MSKIPGLKQKVLEQAKSPALGNYVWKYGAGPQMGYSFNKMGEFKSSKLREHPESLNYQSVKILRIGQSAAKP